MSVVEQKCINELCDYLVVEVHDDNEEHKDQKVFAWNADATRLLITEYHKRLDKFRDPKIKKRELWMEIKRVFEENQYKITEGVLDMKFRNLKYHYKTIKNNKRGKAGRGRVSWEFFDEMDDLFGNDKSIYRRKILTTMRRADSNSDMQGTSPSQRRRKLNLDEITFITKKKKNEEGRGLYRLRQEYMTIERERLETLKTLAEEIRHHNEIQAERNILLKQYLELQENKYL